MSMIVYDGPRAEPGPPEDRCGDCYWVDVTTIPDGADRQHMLVRCPAHATP